MEAKSFEGRQSWKEKVNKDVVDEVEDDSEEEEAGGGLMLRFEENEKQKKAGRRGSGGGGGVSPPCCQAERCGADFSEAKRYYRRHKVCEFHSKAPVVMVSGLRQRFCQQCSRSCIPFPLLFFRFSRFPCIASASVWFSSGL